MNTTGSQKDVLGGGISVRDVPVGRTKAAMRFFPLRRPIVRGPALPGIGVAIASLRRVAQGAAPDGDVHVG